MKIKKITKHLSEDFTELCDLGVEDDHTFYVSSGTDRDSFVLTHNSFPDVDSDSADRDEALHIIADLFGKENVVPVSTFSQLQLRSLIKDVARLNDIPFDEINQYTREIENEAKAEAKRTPGFDAQQWVLTYEEAEKNSKTFKKLVAKYPDFEHTIKTLFKQVRGIGRHAGGVIITDDAPSNMPLIKSGGVVQTPWTEGLNFRHLEEFGFLKFDILGLGTLRMIENCIRKILKNQGHKYVSFEMVKKFYYENLHPDNNDMDDINVYKNVYWNKNFVGIFQFVNLPAQKFVSQMKPTSITDIAVATSIFRPGPLSISADRLYLNNRKNPESVVYKHPLLKSVLEPTCGLVVFQEQLQLIYNKLAGVPMEETDKVRKSFTKKDISNKEESKKAILALKNEFINKCKSVNNIDERISESIFDEVEKFVSYSFNKSHAISYGTLSYQTAHLFTYYPDEWVTTYIDYCATEKGKGTKEDPKAVALMEAQAVGYKIGRADINLSESGFGIVDKNVLIPSFLSLKRCGKTAVEEILMNRPYHDAEELLYNKKTNEWKHSKFNKSALSSLIKIGAFDSLDIVGSEPHHTFKNYKQMHYVLVENYDLLKRACNRKKKTNRELFAQLVEDCKDMQDWSVKEKLANIKEISGSVDTSLIVTKDIKAFLNENGIPSVDSWKSKGQLCWAIINTTLVKTTAKNKREYLRASLIGESGAEHTCFVWGFNSNRDQKPEENTLIISKFDKTDFGLSTNFGSINAIVLK